MADEKENELLNGAACELRKMANCEFFGVMSAAKLSHQELTANIAAKNALD
jgi:hypothetical protein